MRVSQTLTIPTQTLTSPVIEKNNPQNPAPNNASKKNPPLLKDNTSTFVKTFLYPFAAGARQKGGETGAPNLTNPNNSTTVQTILAAIGYEAQIIDDVIAPDLTHYVNQQDADYVVRVKNGNVRGKLFPNRTIIYKMALMSKDRKNIDFYKVPVKKDGTVSGDIKQYKYKSKPIPEQSNTGLGETDPNANLYPDGIKNYRFVEAATENLAASVCKDKLSSCLASSTTGATQCPPSLILGGGHTQGIGTATGTRLAALVSALLTDKVPLQLKPGQTREEVLTNVSTQANKLCAQEKQADILAATKDLVKAVEELIDLEAFRKVQNSQLYKDGFYDEIDQEVPLPENGKRDQDYMDRRRAAIIQKREDRIKELTDTRALSVAELKKFLSRTSEIWVDAHGDCNTEKTSGTKNAHGMPFAAVFGLGALSNIFRHADEKKDGLVHIPDEEKDGLMHIYHKSEGVGFTGGTGFLEINPENAYTVASRNIDIHERKLMDKLGVNINDMNNIKADGEELQGDKEFQRKWGLTHTFNKILGAIKQRTQNEIGHIPEIILSFDIDSMNATGKEKEPGEMEKMEHKGSYATGTPEEGGPNGADMIQALSGLAQGFHISAIDISEFNPTLNIETNEEASKESRRHMKEQYPDKDGTVKATRDLTLGVIESLYAEQREAIPEH